MLKKTFIFLFLMFLFFSFSRFESKTASIDFWTTSDTNYNYFTFGESITSRNWEQGIAPILDLVDSTYLYYFKDYKLIDNNPNHTIYYYNAVHNQWNLIMRDLGSPNLYMKFEMINNLIHVFYKFNDYYEGTKTISSIGFGLRYQEVNSKKNFDISHKLDSYTDNLELLLNFTEDPFQTYTDSQGRLIDSLIVSLIPKELFFTSGMTGYIGKGYGFSILTEQYSMGYPFDDDSIQRNQYKSSILFFEVDASTFGESLISHHEAKIHIKPILGVKTYAFRFYNEGAKEDFSTPLTDNQLEFVKLYSVQIEQRDYQYSFQDPTFVKMDNVIIGASIANVHDLNEWDTGYDPYQDNGNFIYSSKFVYYNKMNIVLTQSVPPTLVDMIFFGYDLATFNVRNLMDWWSLARTIVGFSDEEVFNHTIDNYSVEYEANGWSRMSLIDAYGKLPKNVYFESYDMLFPNNNGEYIEVTLHNTGLDTDFRPQHLSYYVSVDVHHYSHQHYSFVTNTIRQSIDMGYYNPQVYNVNVNMTSSLYTNRVNIFDNLVLSYNNELIYRFKPSVSGVYQLYTSQVSGHPLKDTYIELLDSNFNVIASHGKYSISSNFFQTLSSTNTYYIRVRLYSKLDTGSFNFNIYRVPSNPDPCPKCIVELF